MTQDFPAPPNWPLIIINRTQWTVFEAAGFDMRQFLLQQQIPPMMDLETKLCPIP